MALVKPINIGRGVIPSYWRINKLAHDHLLKTGVATIGGYMSRISREENAEPVFSIEVPIPAEDWKDGLTVDEAYAIIVKNPTFIESAKENTSSPVKERFPESEQAAINAASPEYLEAEARAQSQKDAEDKAAAEFAASGKKKPTTKAKRKAK